MKKRIPRILIAFSMSVGIWPFAVHSTTIEELEQQIKELQSQLAANQELDSNLRQSAENRMSISGYSDVAYTVDSRKEIRPSFQLHHLSLFLKQQVSERWRFFSEIEFENAPQFETGTPITTLVDCGVDGICGTGDDVYAQINTLNTTEGKIFTEAFNLDFTWRPHINIRLGRFFTPAGIWSIDHYPPFTATQQIPGHIYNIFPQSTDGIMFYGIMPIKNHFISYDLYASNGEGNNSTYDMNARKAIGLRLNMDLPYLDNTMIGISYYLDTLNDETDKRVVGMHTKLRQGNGELQAEYANALMEPVIGNRYYMRGYYLQGLYHIDDWAIGLRYDYYDPNSLNPVTERTDSIFADYYISENLNLKLEHHMVHYEDPGLEDHEKTIISINANLGN